MAYLNKEQYDSRRESAAQRMIKNKEISSLTFEQHEFLEELCTIRHEIHCSGISMFCSENSNSIRLWNYIDNGDGTLNGRAGELGFDLQSRNDRMEVPNDADWDIDDCYDNIDIARTECMQWLEEWNNEIEQFLRDIDKHHGTSYCPTGALRIA